MALVSMNIFTVETATHVVSLSSDKCTGFANVGCFGSKRLLNALNVNAMESVDRSG